MDQDTKTELEYNNLNITQNYANYFITTQYIPIFDGVCKYNNEELYGKNVELYIYNYGNHSQFEIAINTDLFTKQELSIIEDLYSSGDRDNHLLLKIIVKSKQKLI